MPCDVFGAWLCFVVAFDQEEQQVFGLRVLHLPLLVVWLVARGKMTAVATCWVSVHGVDCSAVRQKYEGFVAYCRLCASTCWPYSLFARVLA